MCPRASAVIVLGPIDEALTTPHRDSCAKESRFGFDEEAEERVGEKDG